ncbi:MAG: hypothetical protein KIT68_06105, partial [Phycisphaeraceae bacterium]|nr:hypothetical protein [Phycisphaeraceae bacterium]
VRDMLVGAVSLHRFLMPEITFNSATEASGIWMINDYNEWPSDPVTGERCGYKGYGREYETYRKIDGAWKITQYHLTVPVPNDLLERVAKLIAAEEKKPRKPEKPLQPDRPAKQP